LDGSIPTSTAYTGTIDYAEVLVQRPDVLAAYNNIMAGAAAGDHEMQNVVSDLGLTAGHPEVFAQYWYTVVRPAAGDPYVYVPTADLAEFLSSNTGDIVTMTSAQFSDAVGTTGGVIVTATGTTAGGDPISGSATVTKI
jgi:hypothetical protein